jgi:hypothetical protein
MAADAMADGRERQIELHRHRIVIRRAVHGMRMAVNLPLSVYLGVAIHLAVDDEGAESVGINLEHRDPELSVALFAAHDYDDVVAEWQLWARVLELPLLVADRDGNLSEPARRLGALCVADVAPRRRRRNAIKARRPAFLLRRRAGLAAELSIVHRGEREIIARG